MLSFASMGSCFRTVRRTRRCSRSATSSAPFTPYLSLGDATALTARPTPLPTPLTARLTPPCHSARSCASPIATRRSHCRTCASSLCSRPMARHSRACLPATSVPRSAAHAGALCTPRCTAWRSCSHASHSLSSYHWSSTPPLPPPPPPPPSRRRLATCASAWCLLWRCPMRGARQGTRWCGSSSKCHRCRPEPARIRERQPPPLVWRWARRRRHHRKHEGREILPALNSNGCTACRAECAVLRTQWCRHGWRAVFIPCVSAQWRPGAASARRARG